MQSRGRGAAERVGEKVTLPDDLRQQLGRLKEQGCPAALIDRAMGMTLEDDGFEFSGYWNVSYDEHPKRLEFERGFYLHAHGELVSPMIISLHEDGSMKCMLFGLGGFTIPAPQGDA